MSIIKAKKVLSFLHFLLAIWNPCSRLNPLPATRHTSNHEQTNKQTIGRHDLHPLRASLPNHQSVSIWHHGYSISKRPLLSRHWLGLALTLIHQTMNKQTIAIRRRFIAAMSEGLSGMSDSQFNRIARAVAYLTRRMERGEA